MCCLKIFISPAAKLYTFYFVHEHCINICRRRVKIKPDSLVVLGLMLMAGHSLWLCIFRKYKTRVFVILYSTSNLLFSVLDFMFLLECVRNSNACVYKLHPSVLSKSGGISHTVRLYSWQVNVSKVYYIIMLHTLLGASLWSLIIWLSDFFFSKPSLWNWVWLDPRLRKD